MDYGVGDRQLTTAMALRFLNLREIALNARYTFYFDSSVFQVCKRLEKVSLDYFQLLQTVCESFSNLLNLTYLRLEHCHFDLSDMLRLLPLSLRELYLIDTSGHRRDDYAKSISRLRGLEVLPCQFFTVPVPIVVCSFVICTRCTESWATT